MYQHKIHFLVLAVVNICLAAAPYPQSNYIFGISWNWSSHKRLARGSDNWPVTWADNGHQYTSWGDGGGFGGTNSDGRVSLGFGRVEGSADNYQGHNVWGGKNPENSAQFGGKSYGIVCIDGIMYKWVSPGSNNNNYSEACLAKSANHGALWTKAGWAFTKSQGIVIPTICQFGKDYAGARDSYVYHYFIILKDGSGLKVQKPGQLLLARSNKVNLMEQNSYQWYTGMSGSTPTWSATLSSAKPVFEDPNGVGWNLSVSYNAGLQRYLLATEHTESFKSNFGFFEAPEPWGPWKTIAYYSQWSSGQGITDGTKGFFCNFSNKWTSSDGINSVLVFSGISGCDSWNTIKCTFATGCPGNPYFTSPEQVTATTGADFGYKVTYVVPNGSLATITFLKKPSWLQALGDSLYGPAPQVPGNDTFQVELAVGDFKDTLTVTVTIQEAPAADTLITNTSPAYYEWDSLTVGDTAYVDRGFTFLTVPTAYQGQRYLRTANDQKQSTAASLISFNVTQSVVVYIAHDDRITTKPTWLSEFTDTGDDLTTSDASLSLYQKEFAKGTVSLGGNHGTSSSSMYVVVVVPKQESSVWLRHPVFPRQHFNAPIQCKVFDLTGRQIGYFVPTTGLETWKGKLGATRCCVGSWNVNFTTHKKKLLFIH